MITKQTNKRKLFNLNEIINLKIKYEGGCMDHHHENKVLNNRLTDPVCGMAVTEASNFMKKLTIKLFTFAVKIAT
jgi:hypothetical protein